MAQEKSQSAIALLNDRAREIFRHIVDAYIEHGEPVGSKIIAQRLSQNLSSATIRHVMAELEETGLLYAPHISAGRLPTPAGLNLFVNGIMEVGDVADEDRLAIEDLAQLKGYSYDAVLREASQHIAGVSSCAGIVMAPKHQSTFKQIEFVQLAPARALVILVSEDGVVENRLIDLPPGVTASTLIEVTNYLNAKLFGRTLTEAENEIRQEIAAQKTALDQLAQELVAEGIAVWSEGDSDSGYLFVQGQNKLLDDVKAIEELERYRILVQNLERRHTLLDLIGSTEHGKGVQVYIGSDNALFQLSGWSLVLAPFQKSPQKVLGAIGVIGPTRMNYARIIPMVDYTARVVEKLVKPFGMT